jgi:dTDP-4-amino-4,6-dideoxygalactose transaminase
MAVFSLHPVKTITAGEGGLVTTNNKLFYKKIISFRSHGIQRKEGAHWKYNIASLGYNYRLCDLNCSLALSQLSKIKKFINFRHKIYKNYQKLLLKINKYIALPKYNKNNDPAFHLFLISLNNSKKYKKNFLLKFFKDNKILCQYHYIPIYKFQLFPDKVNLRLYQGAEFYYKNTLSLPMFYNLNQALQKKILKKLNLFFN